MNERLKAEPMARTGFTLIELLTVMAIMITMAGIAIGSYFALMRGAGLRSAVESARNTILLARQAAIMESKQAYVMFGEVSASNTMWCMLCMHEGTASGASGAVIWDRYGDLGRIIPGTAIYNLSDNPIQSAIVNKLERTNGMWIVTTSANIWNADDKYGWARGSPVGLPKGFFYGAGSPSVPEPIIFNSDGSTRMQGHTLRIYEEINPTYLVRVIVEGLTGFINVEYP